MSKVLYENGKLKLVESMNEYILVADNLRIVCDEDCKVKWVCVKK